MFSRTVRGLVAFYQIEPGAETIGSHLCFEECLEPSESRLCIFTPLRWFPLVVLRFIDGQITTDLDPVIISLSTVIDLDKNENFINVYHYLLSVRVICTKPIVHEQFILPKAYYVFNSLHLILSCSSLFNNKIPLTYRVYHLLSNWVIVITHIVRIWAPQAYRVYHYLLK